MLPTAHALDRLHEISKTEKIRCTVRRISILGNSPNYPSIADSWNDAHRTFCKSMPAELKHEQFQCPASSSIHAEGYRELLLSQNFGAMLGRALQAFSGIEISVLMRAPERLDNITILGWLEMIKKTNFDVLTKRYPSYEEDAQNDQMIMCSEVVHVCSSLSITKLALEELDPCYINSFAMPQMKIAECFFRLASLAIELECFKAPNRYSGSLCKFLNALTNLQNFKIRITGAESRPIPLLHEVAISSLVTFEFSSICRLKVSDLPDLASFLSHSTHTLRSLSLRNINGEEEEDERFFPGVTEKKTAWAPFLHQLRDDFSLDYLFIRKMTNRIFGDGRDSKHQQSRDIIKTQLHEFLKDFEVVRWDMITREWTYSYTGQGEMLA